MPAYFGESGDAFLEGRRGWDCVALSSQMAAGVISDASNALLSFRPVREGLVSALSFVCASASVLAVGGRSCICTGVPESDIPFSNMEVRLFLAFRFSACAGAVGATAPAGDESTLMSTGLPGPGVSVCV